jgi:hypothetical protein
MDMLVSYGMPVGIASMLITLIVCVSKIIIVKLALKEVPPERRAEVLIAASSLFISERLSRRERPPLG